MLPASSLLAWLIVRACATYDFLQLILACQILKQSSRVTFIGCWQVFRLPAALLYSHREANRVMIKILLPHVLSHAVAVLWIDTAIQLLASEVNTLEGSLERYAGQAVLGVVSDHDAGRSQDYNAHDRDLKGLACSVLYWRLKHRQKARALSQRWWTQWVLDTESQHKLVASARPSTENEAQTTCSMSLTSSVVIMRSGQYRSHSSQVHATNASTHTESHMQIVFFINDLQISTANSHGYPFVSQAAHMLSDARLSHRRIRPRAASLTLAAQGKAHIRFQPIDEQKPGAFEGPLHSNSLDEILSLYSGEAKVLPCGFRTHSSFDAAIAIGSASMCEMVTLTSIFDGFDSLIQPSESSLSHMSDGERGCFYAIVDELSYKLAMQDRARALRQNGLPQIRDLRLNDTAASVGVWKIILLDAKSLPYKR